MILPDDLPHTAFTPLIGQTFMIEGSDQSYPLILESVQELGHRRPEAKRAPFSLIFRGPAGLRGPQQIYNVCHPELGELEIFLTQHSDGPQGSEFGAVFN